MADGSNSGLAHGTSGSPQMTIENTEARMLAKQNEQSIKKTYPGNRTYTEYVDLARDPSHANKVLPQGRKERMIGLDLESQGKLGRIVRDTERIRGAEFIDTVSGIKYDIKSFVSYPNGHHSPRKGAFTLEKAMSKVKSEIRNGHHVIIDTRRLTKSHTKQLTDAVREAGIEDKVIWYQERSK